MRSIPGRQMPSLWQLGRISPLWWIMIFLNRLALSLNRQYLMRMPKVRGNLINLRWTNQQKNGSQYLKISSVNWIWMRGQNPIPMNRMMTRTMAAIRAAGADSPDQFLVLTYEPSRWRGEHYFWVTREVPGLENARLTGDFVAKVFEGPFKDAGKWAAETERVVKAQGRGLKRLYFYYTTCPACAKRYGKNYAVAFAQVD